MTSSQPGLPDPHTLEAVPGTPRKAFQRLMKRCPTPCTPRQLRTTTVILEALERAGLSMRESEDKWLLAIAPEAARMARVWFQLHSPRDTERRGHLPTGLIRAASRDRE